MATLTAEAVAELNRIYLDSGLGSILVQDWCELKEGGKFAKLQFVPNDWRLKSMELWATQDGPYLRFHYGERISPEFKRVIGALPGARPRGNEDRVGINVDGSFLVIASNLAGAMTALRQVGQSR